MAPTSALRAALLTGSFFAVGTVAAWAVPTNYGLLTTIAIPADSANVQPGGAMTGFDISAVDPVTGNYYFADRSNASVDIFSGSTNSFLGRATGFAGQLATTSISGPDGVVVVNSGSGVTLYAGDGGSLLRSFNVTNPANPIAGGTVNTGGTPYRVDEMAYSPASKVLFAANNANTPSFASIVSTATPTAPSLTAGHITITGQTNPAGGLEASVWDPATNTFYVSIPQFGTTDAGGVAQYSASGNFIKSYNFTSQFGLASCSPAGIALGVSGDLVVGCGNSGTQTVVFDPNGNGGAGSLIASVGAVSGSDELWYDPTSADYFLTGVNAAGDRVIDLLSDSSFALLQSIDLTTLGAGDGNIHSVAVDPLNGEIFVPLPGSTGALPDALCPLGCVAVFQQNVPEPASLPLLAVTLTGLVGLAGWRRRA